MSLLADKPLNCSPFTLYCTVCTVWEAQVRPGPLHAALLGDEVASSPPPRRMSTATWRAALWRREVGEKGGRKGWGCRRAGGFVEGGGGGAGATTDGLARGGGLAP